SRCSSTASCFFFFSSFRPSSAPLLSLPSFPTRRSSDLPRFDPHARLYPGEELRPAVRRRRGDDEAEHVHHHVHGGGHAQLHHRLAGDVLLGVVLHLDKDGHEDRSEEDRKSVV